MMNSDERPEKLQKVFAAENCPQLSQEDIEAARELATSSSHRFRKTTRAQAENMAKSAQIELKSDEISLYCALREQMPPDTDKKAIKSEGRGIRPWQLGDQGLLAAVLRLTGDEVRLQSFMKFFSSNIFKIGKEKES